MNRGTHGDDAVEMNACGVEQHVRGQVNSLMEDRVDCFQPRPVQTSTVGRYVYMYIPATQRLKASGEFNEMHVNTFANDVAYNPPGQM